MPGGMKDGLVKITAQWIVGERIPVRSRRAFLAIVLVSAGALGYAAVEIRHAVKPLLSAGPQPTLPRDHDDVRFGVPLAKRTEVWNAVAAGEPQARLEGTKGFPGPALAWSAEDHRGAFERKNVQAAATRFGLNLSVVYLILDEGIRQRWPGPDGEPLRPTTVPLHPRRNYGW